jgi:Arc/MetJ family transcription regulator
MALMVQFLLVVVLVVDITQTQVELAEQVVVETIKETPTQIKAEVVDATTQKYLESHLVQPAEMVQMVEYL